MAVTHKKSTYRIQYQKENSFILLQEIRSQRDRRADVHAAHHVLHHQEAPQRDGHLQQEADQRGRGDQGGGPGRRGQVR